MSTTAIEISGVSRKFRRTGARRPVSAALRRWLRLDQPCLTDELKPDEFWALRNLSLSVQRGEAVALIGPNGAGKSTALKLLAGIMPPTCGRIRVDGRISALIEVGAGFHPDLTGRENIYLNGSVLGMTRSETRRKFDAIVEFAGIEPFLDTPLKRYSSGMYARLGFSVAAHVEPDVLIVDEVLSVGDRVFRSRCMDRMREFLKRGTAILFVSHDLATVASFCDRAYVLSRGETVFRGSAGEAVEHYHRACVASIEGAGRAGPTQCKAPVCRIARVTNRAEEDCHSFASGEDIRVEIEHDMNATSGVHEALLVVRLLRAKDLAQAGACRIRLQAPLLSATGRTRVQMSLNVPSGEYVIRCLPQLSDRAGPMDPGGEARIMVRGRSESGGLADLRPEFEFSA